MRTTYFGETKEEEEARIKDLWKKSLLAFVIAGVFLAVANKQPLAIMGGIVPFFLVWGFQACFSKAGSFINFVTDLIPIALLKYIAKLLMFAFLGIFIGMFYFVLGNVKLYSIKKGSR